MKIKTLLAVLLAVCVVALSGCGKDEENYTESFKGTYTMTMTPIISMSVEGIEVEVPVEAIENVKCTITETSKNNVLVTLLDESSSPILAFSGTCDESGIHLKSYTISETVYIDEEYGYADLDLTFGSATVSKPVNGNISWVTSLSGTVGMDWEVTPGYTIPMVAELAGNITFSGTK